MELNALIDSGASRSLIRKKCVPTYERKPSSGLCGLGGKKVDIIGRTQITLKLYDTDTCFKGLVVKDEDIRYDLILGADFLRWNKFKISLSKRKITITRQDSSIVTAHLDKENRPIKLKY